MQSFTLLLGGMGVMTITSLGDTLKTARFSQITEMKGDLHGLSHI